MEYVRFAMQKRVHPYGTPVDDGGGCVVNILDRDSSRSIQFPVNRERGMTS